jgi:hypothetical protein
MIASQLVDAIDLRGVEAIGDFNSILVHCYLYFSHIALVVARTLCEVADSLD